MKRRTVKLRVQLEEDETAAECVIDEGERAVCRVHQTDKVDILWNREPLAGGLGIGEGDRKVGTTFVRFDEHHQLAEDLAEVAAVDLVNDEHKRALAIEAGAVAEVVEDTIPSLEAARLARTIALDEVLVGVGLVELDHFHVAFVLLRQKGVGKTSSDKGFANTGRALKDHVFLSA